MPYFGPRAVPLSGRVLGERQALQEEGYEVKSEKGPIDRHRPLDPHVHVPCALGSKNRFSGRREAEPHVARKTSLRSYAP